MTAGLLSQVSRGISKEPRRTLLYGTHGIGKSTWCSCSNKPIFIQPEDGLGRIDVPAFPVAENLAAVMTAIGELYTEKHAFETVVIDTLDFMERLIFAEVCKDHKVTSIEDLGYAKGYTYALDYWSTFLEGLSALRAKRQMTVLMIAHAQIEKFDNPETDSYDRFVPALHKKASRLVQEWCDEVLFATYKVSTVSEDKGFGKKRHKAIGTSDRVLRTVERPYCMAKNRLGLPTELPLVYSEYAKHFNGTTNPKKKKGTKTDD